MSTLSKRGATRGVRPKGETLQIIEEAEALNMKVADLIEEVLDANRQMLKRRVEAEKDRLRGLLQKAA